MNKLPTKTDDQPQAIDPTHLPAVLEGLEADQPRAVQRDLVAT
jgi:hypothetical protein